MRRFPVVPALLVVGCFAAAPSAWAAEVYKWTDENGVAHYSDAPPEGQQYDKVNVRGKIETEASPEAPATPPPTTPPKTNNQSNCEQARKNVATFESSAGVSMDRDGDGTPEVLTEQERREELERTQALIKLYCK